MTNKQKADRYKKALEMYLQDIKLHNALTGMCYYIACAFDLPTLGYKSMVEGRVMELYQYQPSFTNISDFWWPLYDRQPRIDIFNKIIKQLEDESKI